MNELSTTRTDELVITLRLELAKARAEINALRFDNAEMLRLVMDYSLRLAPDNVARNANDYSFSNYKAGVI